ncbi:MAG: glucose-1-phosphate adenylyltransferase [Lachnospiraceae bacterium]|nr:glucose-1-phosphate adenylyltransferase [Lachnospiraceae bacterium]
MIRKEMIAMLLAGGQGSQLGILTDNVAKSALSFGGKYRIIDFPLSNLVNSGIDTIGVLTQYRPLRLTSHIGIGIPWDLDRNSGGVAILPSSGKGVDSDWITGTAGPVAEYIDYIDQYDPDYVLIVPADRVYKMDYEVMLDYHIALDSDVTVASMRVPEGGSVSSATMLIDAYGVVEKFEPDTACPCSNLESMRTYLFDWQLLKKALLMFKEEEVLDFEKHIIPQFLKEERIVSAYEWNGYYRDVPTAEEYWKANLELVGERPELSFYEKFWTIYTNGENLAPAYIADSCNVTDALLSEGSEVYGVVERSVIGPGTVVSEGAVVRNSVIQEDCFVARGAVVENAVIARGSTIGSGAVIGSGEGSGICVIGEDSIIPDGAVVLRQTEKVGGKEGDRP